MFNSLFFLLEGEASGSAAASGSNSSNSWVTFVMLAAVVVFFYFFLIRPQKKQEKETTDMRNSIERGDIIVTTGGIIGMVVKIKEDMLLIETGGDRTKIQIKKWAVHAIIEKANAPEVVEEPKKK